MAHIHELLRQLRATGGANVTLADEFEREYDVLSDRRAFGLNFERHTPEAVELPGRQVRTGDKVHMLPPRGEMTTDATSQLWRVSDIKGTGNDRFATLVPHPPAGPTVTATAAVADLVVVAEFRDPIYPGLVSTGKVERGGVKPHHAVINAENYHALQALLFTHRGKVDAIYIDPPYNSGAKDWKYNNHYVEGDDLYRHSKWLAMMERRLVLAKELLKLEDSVLIVAVDEKEYLRLGMLLGQVLPAGNVTMVSTVINPAGAARNDDYSRTDEYLFFVRFGASKVLPEQRDEQQRPVTWDTLRRSDLASKRGSAKGGRSQFFPIYVNERTGAIDRIGEPLDNGVSRTEAPNFEGLLAVFPVRPDGTEMNWGLTPESARERLAGGYLRAGKRSNADPQKYAIAYLTGGIVSEIEDGRVVISNRAPDGSVIAHYATGRKVMSTTAWNKPSHDAQRYGTELLKALIPGRRFPFPKALYAVEDSLRNYLGEKKDAVVLDFFAGSGTTAHAVMRLNRQDGGRRVSISVTNNEVSPTEQADLRGRGIRAGEAEWEKRGICDDITKPRVLAAVTGRTPDGSPIEGDYKFYDQFAISDGFEENVEFFTLTYEAPLRIRANRDFQKISSMLWLRAGSKGERIETLDGGWAVGAAYGVLADLDKTDAFVAALSTTPTAQLAFVITDDDHLFEAVVSGLPEGVEPVRLYDAYFRNFEIDAMRGVR